MSKLVEHDGKLYVKVKYSGIPMFCIMTDGLTLVGWDKRKEYINIKDAINWHFDEGKYTECGEQLKKIYDAWEQLKKNINNIKE